MKYTNLLGEEIDTDEERKKQFKDQSYGEELW